MSIPLELEIEGNIYRYVKKGAHRTHVIALLDRSGSMGPLVDSTIEGYNGFIDNLKDENVDVTTVLFDDVNETLWKKKKIELVPKLTRRNYFTRGGTALIDAVCETIGEFRKEKADRYIVLIITDGQENSSRRYTSQKMRSMIERLEGAGNWTFTYMGANQDSWAEAQKWGFQRGNVMDFRATDVGVGVAYASASLGSLNTVRGASMNTANFFGNEPSGSKNAK